MRDTRFDVWAPKATRMRVRIEQDTYEMRRDRGDWWRPVDLPELLGELDSGYLIDDEETVTPDPRSRRHPTVSCH